MSRAPRAPDRIYSAAELGEMIEKMKAVSMQFYVGAVASHCHTFIEFTGLMNEYIKVCEQTLEAGLDFTVASIHGGGKLVIHGFNAHYLAEKFACIFETSLEDPKIRKTFIDAIEGKGR